MRSFVFLSCWERAKNCKHLRAGNLDLLTNNYSLFCRSVRFLAGRGHCDRRCGRYEYCGRFD